jgi:hypothetical protein
LGTRGRHLPPPLHAPKCAAAADRRHVRACPSRKLCHQCGLLPQQRHSPGMC